MNPNARKAAIFADWVEAAPDQVLNVMQGIDLDRKAVVETSSLPERPEVTDLPVPEQVSWSAERSSYRTESSTKSVLVLFERFAPGWQAELEDGTALEVFPADYIFRGVVVPPGHHSVTFHYRPDGFRVGILVSLTTLLFLFLLRAGCLLRDRQNPRACGRNRHDGSARSNTTGGSGGTP
jgi:hypothetical protein